MINSADLTAWYREASALQRAGNLPDAERLYRAVVDADPYHAEALSALGAVCLQSDRLEEGLQLIDSSLAIAPEQPHAFNNRGNALRSLKRYDEALQSFDQAIALDPRHADAFSNRGVVFGELGRLEESLASIDRSLALRPDHADGWNNRGKVLLMLRRYDEALGSYDRLIALRPDQVDAYTNRGNILVRLGRLNEALASYDRVFALRPDHAEVLYRRGIVLGQLGRPDEACDSYSRAIELRPGDAGALCSRGNTLRILKRYDEALQSYERAIALRPDYADAFNNRGVVLDELGRPDESLESFDRAIALRPDHSDAHNNRGTVLRTLRRFDEALESFDRTITLRPDYADAFNNRGVVLGELGRLADALDSYDRAIALQPDHADAFYNRGVVLDGLGRLEESLESLERAYALKPATLYLNGALTRIRMCLCDWSNLDSGFQRNHEGVARGEAVITPFAYLSMPSSPTQQRRCAEIHLAHTCPNVEPPTPFESKARAERLRLGYFSADFRNHPVAFAIAEVFENHDRNAFEVFGFSYDLLPEHAMRKQIADTFDHFFHLPALSDREIALKAREVGIDIAIDMMGHTKHSRLGIHACRPAPVQASFFGYPGTTGATFIDYMIGDRTIIPESHLPFFAERLAYLPDTYLPTSPRYAAAESKHSRSEASLPESGFVFCCFHNYYKITPQVFRIWMRLLQRVPGSVLWLLAENVSAQRKLSRAAEQLGVAPSRLIFAPRISRTHHIARHRLADLFLDTWPYNAHTTASDALWVGLPVLTYLGSAFAGRVAASILNAVGLPELITQSHEEYEALALDLALNPVKLAAIREKLWRNRLTHPLFDVPRYTRNLEAAYTRMWQRHQDRLPPETFYV